MAAPTTSVVPTQSSEAGIAGHAAVFDAALANEAGQVRSSDSADSAEPLLSADASSPQSVSADAGTVGADSAHHQPACGVAGNYALRIEFDVSWGPATTSGLATSDLFPGLPPMGPSPGTLPLFSSLGSGTITLDARLTLEGGDEGGRARFSPCGVALPDFDAVAYGRASERYGVTLPSATWDASAPPEWSLLWTRSCSSSVPCSFGLNTMVRRLGADVTGVDATGQPSSVEAVDVDGDGQPGLTFMLRGPSDVSASGAAYAYLPVAADQRARKLMFALGFSTSLEGTFDLCDRLSGSAFDNAFERRVLGCTAVVDGTTSELPCADGEVQALERSFPSWVISWASFRAVRIADNTCAAVRDARL